MIYNARKHLIIWALPRCGSGIVFRQVMADPKRWDHIRNDDIGKMKVPPNVIKVVRDPVERFVSYVASFIINNKDPEINYYLPPLRRNNFDDWFEKFSRCYHYDSHTNLQSIVYYSNMKLNHHVKYLHTKDLSKFFYVQNYTNLNREFYRDYLEPMLPKVKELYKHDYEWLDSIKDQFVDSQELNSIAQEHKAARKLQIEKAKSRANQDKSKPANTQNKHVK